MLITLPKKLAPFLVLSTILGVIYFVALDGRDSSFLPAISQVQAISTNQTVVATQDTYIKVSAPDTNFSSSMLIEGSRYKLSGTEMRVAMVGFDLTPYAGKIVTAATLKFETTDMDSSTTSVTDYKSKGIKIYPYLDLSTVTYNSFLARNSVGQVLTTVTPAFKSYEYPYIHTFILFPTANTADEQFNRAKVTANGNGAFVEIPLQAENLRNLPGHKFTLLFDNQRGDDILIRSLESAATVKPQLFLTLDDAPASTDTSGVVVQELNSCSSPELQFSKNALTGLHRRSGISNNPHFDHPELPIEDRGEPDVYKRFEWNEFESDQGNYTGIATQLDPELAALKPGQKFGFRIRPMIEALEVPSYIASTPGATMSCSGIMVPNWNDPFFLSRSEALLQALGTYLSQSNRADKIAWIDMGFTGRWGETNGACVEQMTQASLERYVDMYTNSFPNIRLLSMTDDSRIAKYALAKPANNKGMIGLRRDSMGGDSGGALRFGEISSSFDSFHLMKDRWKTAPYAVEFGGSINNNITMWDLSVMEMSQANVTSIGNSNSPVNPFSVPIDPNMARERALYDQLALGAGFDFEIDKWGLPSQLVAGTSVPVYTAWKNTGNAPAYEKYKASLVFKNTVTQATQEFELSSVGFESMLPTKHRITGVSMNHEFVDNLTLPTTAGQYQVFLKVIDGQVSTWPRRPMALCNAGLQTDKTYLLGQVAVIDQGGSVPPTASPSASPSSSPTATPSASPSPSTCSVADIDQDNDVDMADYDRLVAVLFTIPSATAREDIVDDGYVDILDYSFLSTHFGQTCL